MKEEKDYKATLNDLLYHVLFGVWYLLSKLPMWVLYLFSSLISVVFFYVVRYRRKLVHKNMKDAYPELSSRRRWLMERRFYTHFCDIFMESVKYFSISEKEMRRRMTVKGLETVEESCRNGRSCGVYLGHYANWEWISAMPLWLPSEKCTCTQLYHALRNPVFDRLVSYTRQRFGGVNIPVEESVRHFVKYKKEGKPVLIGFIADQVPFWNNIHYWTTFLNHPETPVFSGPERIMKKFDMDVYYLDVRRVRRGHYSMEFKLITTTPKDCEEFELTERYTRMLEHTINRAPSYWLWTHNRWKRTKKELEEIQERGIFVSRPRQESSSQSAVTPQPQNSNNNAEND